MKPHESQPDLITPDTYEPTNGNQAREMVAEERVPSRKSVLWKLIKLGIATAGCTAVISIVSGSTVLALLLAALMLLPIYMLSRIISDNVGRIHNATPTRLFTSILLTLVYSAPILPLLAPAVVINYAVDIVLDLGVAAVEKLLATVDEKWETVSKEEAYPWYSPWRWAGYNKVVNVVRSLEVPRYTGMTRLALKTLRDFIVALQLYWYGVLIYVVIRTFGYIMSRVLSQAGMTLQLAFPR